MFAFLVYAPPAVVTAYLIAVSLLDTHRDARAAEGRRAADRARAERLHRLAVELTADRPLAEVGR